ncbi:endolytic transglycosylase MltG [Rhodobacteraceae bacterium]|nr:endolytic transglycosylase MltG [Paracoccaceae bacterium]
MWRNLASNFLTILIVALIGVAVVIGWGQRQYVAEGPLEEPMCLQVPRGGSMARVADQLSELGAVSNATIYRLGAQYSGKSPSLKAGSFLIEEGTSMQEIVAEITGDGLSTCGTEIIYLVSVNGQSMRVRELDTESQEFATTAEFDPKDEAAVVPEVYASAVEDVGTRFRVVVAEGVTSWQVVEALRASDLFEGEVAAVPEEGSLAPDGYEIRPGADRAEFLANMASAQENFLASAWEARAADAPVETPEEALILASIIEKETGVADERPLVASVFANRLRRGIKLQTDPTVIYGVTEGKSVLGRGLRQSELRARTPWNTYVIDGLPPTPIANPGRASIEAALAPAESDYIFFVADGTGGHAFAVTLDEHNANVAKWRQIERDRANADN